MTILNNCRIFYERDRLSSIVFDEKIIFIGSFEAAKSFAGENVKIIDAKGAIAVPGFVDIHNHGGAGFDFAVANEDEMKSAVMAHLMAGTTSILPTVASADNETFIKMFDVYRNVLKENTPLSKCLKGIHLEGPYLNPGKKGAMPEKFLKLPLKENYEPLLEKGADIVKRFTIAPELPGAFELGEKLSKINISVSIGHTEASPEIVKNAYNHGFTFGTHLFNAMTSMHKEGIFRKTGVAEAILSMDFYGIEVISDCIHVPPEILRMCWLVKGTNKMALITDAISASGGELENGKMYSFVDGNILIEDGVAKLPDRSAIAGSIACGNSMLKCAVDAGIPFEDAVTMMTKTPASICNIPNVGRLSKGYYADIVLLDDNFDVINVYKAGVCI